MLHGTGQNEQASDLQQLRQLQASFRRHVHVPVGMLRLTQRKIAPIQMRGLVTESHIVKRGLHRRNLIVFCSQRVSQSYGEADVAAVPAGAYIVR